jgi:gliding motility-associated-like protein
MKHCLYIFILLAIVHLSSAGEPLKLMCDVDVSILEGEEIVFCSADPNFLHATPGFIAYAWTGPQTGSSSSLQPTSSGQYIVTAIDAVGCVSKDTIQVTINPSPVGVILSSEGNVLCPGSAGTLLSMNEPFASYLWSDGSTNSTLQIQQGGTYTVDYIDFNGCAGTSAITILQPNFALSLNGSETVCSGSTTTIVASGGGTYLWSTGETGPSIVVAPTANTSYSVIIMNGSCSTTLTQNIYYLDIPAATVEDTFYVNPGNYVELSGPDGYTSYTWTPYQDLSSFSTQLTNFIGDSTTQYNVFSTAPNGCERNDSIVVIVLRFDAPTGFSPNGDLINDLFVVPGIEIFNAKLTVFNRWGDKVYERDHYQNDWDGTCGTPLCMGQGPLPEGTYYYSITVSNSQVDGFTTIKR